MKRIVKILLLALFFFGLIFLVRGSAVKADQLEELNKQIAEYQAQISKLQQQANTLSNQIAQFNAQIKLTELKISQTEEEINLLSGRIDQLGSSLSSLSTAFASRAVETYKMSRSSEIPLFVLTSDNLSELFTRFHYLRLIQEADRDLLVRLQRAQNIYKEERTEAEALQVKLQEQRTTLASQKAAKANLLTVTRGDETRYQQLLAQARAQLAALRRYVTSQGGASILSDQTKCDSWGCYYNQRDSLWGNMGLGGSSYSVAEYGCLVTSVSMLASHLGRNIKPSDIAVVPSAFVPGTGYLNWVFSVNGVGISVTSASKSELDQKLASGPVIAGLYGGPDHFIVILRKEGDKYIMHDPFMPDGANRPLTDKYSVSDITTLRLVTFN